MGWVLTLQKRPLPLRVAVSPPGNAVPAPVSRLQGEGGFGAAGSLRQKARTGLSWVCEQCLAQAVPGTGLCRGQTHLGPPLGWQEFPRTEEGVGSQASWLLHSKTEALPKYRSFSCAAVLWVTLWDWRWVQDYRQCFTLLLRGSLELTWKATPVFFLEHQYAMLGFHWDKASLCH